ncbi:MAG: shikimate dehydrogenase [Cyanobacteria bacterium SIG32]|nr:shikimate dehydrogenase [Cyanobacteria bacterium SIG32]
MTLNKDLYERYLAKKAKKLGVSVESLRGASSQTTGSQSTEQSQSENVVQASESNVEQQQVQQVNTYVQPTYPQQTYSQPVSQQTLYYQPSQTVNRVVEPTIIDRRENKFAVIGFPLGHSLSSVIHTVGFKSMGLDAIYETLETDPEDLVSRIKMLKNGNYKGFNVTIPLKLPIAMFIDEVDKSADIAGAINTVVINPDRTMKGYNTDVMGFKKAIPSDFKLFGKVAGILGTGGASRAATIALAQAGVKEIRYYTRNIPNCLDLLNYMRRIFPQVQFDAYQIEFIRDLSMVDILVNTTPIGMLGRSADMTPVEKPQLMTLPQGALVYDVIYNPRKTVFLKLAESLGYKTVNGLDMFIGQAVAAEEIWTGRIPNVDSMKIALLEAL